MADSKKFSQIALIGAPNVGKSTLTNFLVGQKISIVSPKVQTTRNTIKAIMVEGDTQIVFLDTPGVFIPKTNRPLERSIVKNAWSAIKDADFVCLIIDATKGVGVNNKKILEDLEFHQIKPIIIINKIDLVAKEKSLEIIAFFADKNCDKIFVISAKNGDGVEDVKKHLLAISKAGQWQFNDDEITDAPMKFIAAEITREKLFLKLKQDLPYCLFVKTDSWQDLNNGQVKIHQSIIVLKESQKMIVLGKNGQMIKEIGQIAREEISKMLGAKAHLFLFVKVEPNWINKKENYEQYN